MEGLDLRLGADLQRRPVHGPHRGADPRAAPRDPRVKMLRFSRRFGQPMATIAGLEAASGDATVVIDCDLQDPPELIPELVARWREGYDVVYAQRRTRAGETLPKRIIADMGYRVISAHRRGRHPAQHRRLPPDEPSGGRQRRGAQESHGFLRGLVGLVGFRRRASSTTATRARRARASTTASGARW